MFVLRQVCFGAHGCCDSWETSPHTHPATRKHTLLPAHALQAAWVQAGTSCGSKAHAHTRQPAGPPTWAAARAANAVARDFTANALLYDPFGRLLFDYVGGLPDIGARRLAAIGDAEASLAHDPVRLLRAVRCAARTGVCPISIAMDSGAGLVCWHCSSY